MTDMPLANLIELVNTMNVDINPIEAEEIADEMIERFGSVAHAIVAIEAGFLE